MSTEKNVLLRTVLQSNQKYIGDDRIHPYHLLFGYAKLLSMDDSVLRIMFTDEESLRDLENVRRFFSENKIDPKLVKTGMPYLFSYLKDADADTFCTETIRQILDGEEEVSSYDVLKRIFKGGKDSLTVFLEGKTIEDVFVYQKVLKEKAGSKREQEGGGSSDSGDKAGAADHAKTADDAGGGDVPEEPEEPVRERNSLQKTAEKYRKLRIDLLDVVKGQNDAVREFVQGCFQGEVLKNSGRRKTPKAFFLFVGPPGVGKTLLAQTAADSLGYPCMMLNMSEYSAPQSHEGLIGISSFYNKAEEGRLVKFVRENPSSILIFDEIEKAHSSVIQLFLQILDLGELDNVFLKKKTEFSDTIIIFTSNACKSIYENDYGNISRTPKNLILDALLHEKNPESGNPTFPAAICSRLAAGNMIMFNHLRTRDMVQMISSSFESTAEQIEKEYGYKISFDSKLPLLFLFHQGGAMDARIASRQSDKFIKNELFEISRQLDSHRDLLEGIDTFRFEIDLDDPGSDEEMKSLFRNQRIPEVVAMCGPEERKYFGDSSVFQVHFADSADELKKLLENDIDLVFIDLRFGLKEDGRRGISLDDYDAVGVKAFRYLEENQIPVPVYLIESGTEMTDSDRNIYLQKGAAGIVSAIGAPEQSVIRQLQQIAEEILMERQSREFSRRGYVMGFNTAQIMEGSVLKIQYHSFTKRQAISTEDAVSFVTDAERPEVHFEDVIGAEKAKDELQYFIKYLSNPRKFIREGGKPAKGVLLYGPPGTGKTMLARAMAGESEVFFIQTSATEFMNKWFGQSEQNVRNLFRKAKEFAPAIIFIDEIDAIGKTRTGENPHVESVLNTLLTEIDGFRADPRNPVFVLAATNYLVESDGSGKMTLDPALVRRFDNRIYVDLPNEKERLQYLKLSVAKKGFAAVSEETLKNIASRTPGLSIAILQNVVDLAFRNAKKQDRLPGDTDLQNALEEYNYGERHEWEEGYYRSVAVHEAGHAYLAFLAGEKPSYITIESRGDFGGYMSHESSENKPNYTKAELIWRIRCSLAGRAAEEVFFGKEASLNTGASSDLQNASSCALRMICDYGMMDGQLVALPFKTITATPLASAYLEQANQLLQREMAVTLELLEKGKDKVQALADALIRNNHLTGTEILKILGGN